MRPRHGLLVGKFAPLHKGHELAIATARAHCDNLTLLSYSNPEFDRCGVANRERWLKQSCPTARVIVVPGDRFPSNEAPDDEQRNAAVEFYLHEVGEPLDVVFTSEAYGAPFAAELSTRLRSRGIQHHEVVHHEIDRARSKVPISAREIRRDPHALRKWLPDYVYRDFVSRVVFLGGESTGKTTLCDELARMAGTTWVEEYGRTLWVEKAGRLELPDLLTIAERHVEHEEQALSGAVRHLFVDTSPLTTLFYSESMFGRVDPRLAQLAERAYDRVFLCAPDFEFVQDGTRVDAEFRQKGHEWYLRELSRRKIAFDMLTGTLAERLRQVSQGLGL